MRGDIMITRNQRMGPRNSFMTHHRSTTSREKTEIRGTDVGVKQSDTKTTETYTSGARTEYCNDSGVIQKIPLRKIAEQ